MQHHTILKLAASTLVLGVTMVGCKPAADGSRPESVSRSGTVADKQAHKASNAALNAVRGNNISLAVAQAETAVALSPRDAGYRATLADIYLKGGRFASAASAYADALQLNSSDGKTALSLALSQIALGRHADAIATLSASTGAIPSADHGLALALAGDREGALRLLNAAARAPEATGRVRQNLALTYALAGDWVSARSIAAQDVSPDELDARMAAWAAFAQPKAASDQVATLLGVSPASDAGMPVRLALNPNALVQTAAVEVVATPEAEPVAVAVADLPAPPMVEEAPVAYAENAAADSVPVLAAAIASVESVLPRQMAQPLARTLRAASTAPQTFKGRYVVQLGAFAGADRVEKAWNGAVSRLDRLANYIPASTRVSVGGGASLTRLSVGGFSGRQGAAKLCNSLRAAGGTCFVRVVAGDAPVRWASRAARNG